MKLNRPSLLRNLLLAFIGFGLVMGRVAGIKRAVLTGRDSAIVARRAGELRFDAVKLGRFDKVAALEEILTLAPHTKVIVVTGNGDLDKALTVKAYAFSLGAVEKIKAAGGKVED